MQQETLKQNTNLFLMCICELLCRNWLFCSNGTQSWMNLSEFIHVIPSTLSALSLLIKNKLFSVH